MYVIVILQIFQQRIPNSQSGYYLSNHMINLQMQNNYEINHSLKTPLHKCVPRRAPCTLDSPWASPIRGRSSVQTQQRPRSTMTMPRPRAGGDETKKSWKLRTPVSSSASGRGMPGVGDYSMRWEIRGF